MWNTLQGKEGHSNYFMSTLQVVWNFVAKDTKRAEHVNLGLRRADGACFTWTVTMNSQKSVCFVPTLKCWSRHCVRAVSHGRRIMSMQLLDLSLPEEIHKEKKGNYFPPWIKIEPFFPCTIFGLLLDHEIPSSR